MITSTSQMRAIIALWEVRNFSRAAKQLNMTQSALSQSIKQVEDRYGVALFERGRGGVRPTVFGKIVVEAARASLIALEKAGREIASLQSIESGSLVVGVDPFLASSILGPVLEKFIGEHPAFKVTVRSGDFKNLEGRLLDGELDVIFGFDPQFRTPAIDLTPFQMPNAKIVCNPGHPLLQSEVVSLQDVFEFSVVSLPLPAWFVSFAAERIDRKGEEGSIRNELILEADNIEIVKTLVIGSNAVTGAFPNDIAFELESGKLAQLNIEGWPLEITGIIGTLNGKLATPAQSLLENMFLEMAVDLAT